MHHPRWFLYGIVDGAVVGGAVVVGIALIGGAIDLMHGIGNWEVLAWAGFGALYGAAVGFAFGLLCGMVIDLLRQFGLNDCRAVGLTMVPVLCGVLVVAGTHLADGGVWLAVAVAAVVADLCWRLSRLDRRTPTVLT